MTTKMSRKEFKDNTNELLTFIKVMVNAGIDTAPDEMLEKGSEIIAIEATIIALKDQANEVLNNKPVNKKEWN